LSALLSRDNSEAKQQKRSAIETILIWALAILGMVLLFMKTGSLGWLQYAISGLGGVLIVLIGYLVYELEVDDEPLTGVLETKRHWVLFTIILTVIAALLSLFMGWSAYRIIFGVVAVLFLPGFALSFNFFKPGEIDSLERLALSIALSIAVVPLVVFYLNLVGVDVSVWLVLFVVFIVIVGSIMMYKKKHIVVARINKRNARK
jgi:hypothetical protein